MAVSAELPPLSQAPNLSLVGYVAAYYLPQADLLADPELASPGLVSADLQLAPDAGWRQLPTTPHTLKLEETPKTTSGVTTYQVRVSALRPQPNESILTALAALDRRPLLLLVIEATGRRRLLGSSEEFVLLSTSGEGQNPATRSGVELRLEGSATRRAPYYEGRVPVLSGAPPPISASAGTGYVNIFDRRGKLMARVKAGTDVTITSSFKVTLSF